MVTSVDGITWTACTGTFPQGVFGIAYNGFRWVAVGQTTTANSIVVSEDGIAWTAVGVSGQFSGGNNGRCVLWDGRRWLAGGTASMLKSSDGLTWDGTGFSGNLLTTLSLAYNGTYYIAGGAGALGVDLARSLDGLTWTTSGTAATFSVQCAGVASNDKGTWIAVGASGGGASIVRSIDNGANWTTTTGDSFVSGNGVVWNGTVWIATGAGGGASVLVSTDDGVNWTSSGVTNAFASGGNSVASANIWKTYPTTTTEESYLFTKLINDLYAARGSLHF
jgi:hypothetical protein